MTTMDKPTHNRMCSIPWSHLQIDPDGSARPCCISQPIKGSIIGNIHNSSLDELWNSERLKQLRVNILEGKDDPLCELCHNYDNAGLSSFRLNVETNMRQRFSNVDEAISNTNETGHCSITNMEYWDFRFSNMCNFKCRTCGPTYSSLWYADAEKIGWSMPKDKKPITWLAKVEDRIATLAPHVDKVKEIYFAGGEPLIMEEHFRTLDLLLANNRTDVKLRYNTNLSTLKYKGFDILNDYWSKFQDVEISGSLDAVGERAEYIRYGTKWSVVDSNIRRIAEAAKNNKVKLMFNVTISTLNIFYLDEILDYFIDIGVVNDLTTYDARPWQFIFNLVFYPEYYCIRNLPDSAKLELTKKFNNFDQKLKSEYGVNYSFFTDLYPIMNEQSSNEKIEQFIKATKELDAIRNEDIGIVLPEVWKHYNR